MENLHDYLSKEYNAHFSGWDFSYLNGRMILDKLPWDYKDIVEKYSSGRNKLLDMDTGGGEFLCSLKGLPKNVFATEGYEPNIPIAESKLKEKGIHLKSIKTKGEIPFDDEYFDIIINKHGYYETNEIKRALQKDGYFITQQVGGLDGIDINITFGANITDNIEWSLIKNINNFKNLGMEILDYDSFIGKRRFTDIGAIVFYLKCIPWQIKDFSIDKYYEKLETINDFIKNKGYIEFIMSRFYMIVKKK